MELAFQLIDIKTIVQIVFVSILLNIGITLIVRISGKKSISQLTLPQLVTVISLGSIITTPLNQQKTIMGTLIAVLTFVLMMMLFEELALINKLLEKFFMNKPTLLIKDGKIIMGNLKKIRMGVNELESHIREKGISSFSELRTCTLELSGNIGYEKIKDYKPYKNNLFDEIREGKNNKEILENLK